MHVEVCLNQANLNSVVVPYYQAVEKFNWLIDEGKRVVVLIYVTC